MPAHLFHAVFPYAQMIAVDRMGGELRPLLESAQANAEEAMQKLQQSVFLRGISCETEVRAGPAIDEICAASGRDNIELVVTSTHGRRGFYHALMGSVAEHSRDMRNVRCWLFQPRRFLMMKEKIVLLVDADGDSEGFVLEAAARTGRGVLTARQAAMRSKLSGMNCIGRIL